MRACACSPRTVPSFRDSGEFRSWLIHWISCTELTRGMYIVGDSLKFTYLKEQAPALWRLSLQAFPPVIMFDSIFEYFYHLPHLQRGNVRLKEIGIPSCTPICHQSVNTQALSPHMVEETDVKWLFPGDPQSWSLFSPLILS